MTVCNDCAQVRVAVARPGVTARGHKGPATGRVTITGLVTGLPFLLTGRSHRRGVGAGIARRQLLLPGIAATLG